MQTALVVAQNSLTFVRVAPEMIEIRLENPDPVAGIQFSVNVPPGVTISGFEPSSQVSGSQWMFGSNQPSDYKLNVVALSLSQSVSLESGSWSLGTFSVTTDKAGQGDPFDINPNDPMPGQGTLATLDLSAPYPNPFNPSTEMGYTLLSPGDVRIAVYDVLGREITVLDQGWKPEGSGSVRWDGRDNAGRGVASGLYFITVMKGQEIKVQRVALKK
jgi:hypothetical protein